MRFFIERMAVLAVCGPIVACAATATHQASATTPTDDVSGVWEGSFRSTVSDGVGGGDTRFERQAWRLSQKGDTVTGFYVVELTMVSGDGRPYLCNHEPSFSALLRIEVRGRAARGGIELEEVGDALTKGPCHPTMRTRSRYRAAVRGNILTLNDGTRRLPLSRRPPEQADSLFTMHPSPERSEVPQVVASISAGPPRTSDPAEAPADIDGLWIWEHRGPLPSGDEKVEREEWHMVQEGTKLSGYYDRAVHQISTDGHAYRCNAALDFRVTTRYQITGEVQGSVVTIYERGFEILEGSPCDDGRRRLDAYQGQAGMGEIRLMWGVGTQVLHRARPNVPTQRF